jgi:pilus assembly protein CpaE
MKTKHNIVVLTNDVDTESTLRILFGTNDRIGEIQVHRTLDSLSAALERGLAPLVLVDIDADPLGMLERLDPIVNHCLHTKFVVLARELENDVVLQAMQVGIRYVQLKERIAIELPSVIQRVLSSVPVEGRRRGSAITVLSAGGGAGCTTLTVNLANELQLTTSEAVLIADLDYAYGAVASYLELEGKYGIADVLAYEGAIDADLIETTSVRYSDMIRALLSPASTGFGRHGHLSEERLSDAIGACRARHRYTVFDAPRISMDAAAALAIESEMTLIVLQPVVKDIRVTRNMIQALLEREVPVERIKPILNRYRKRREIISVDEAQKALGGIAPECLSNDYVSAINGNNYGKLLSVSAPRSTLRRDVMELASQFSALDEKRSQETEKAGAAFRRLTA